MRKLLLLPVTLPLAAARGALTGVLEAVAEALEDATPSPPPAPAARRPASPPPARAAPRPASPPPARAAPRPPSPPPASPLLADDAPVTPLRPRPTPPPPPPPPADEPPPAAAEAFGPPEPTRGEAARTREARREAEATAGSPGPEIRIDEPWPGYAKLRAPDIVDRLAAADDATKAMVRLFESEHRKRRTVLAATEP
jgi:hypothetical protein